MAEVEAQDGVAPGPPEAQPDTGVDEKRTASFGHLVHSALQTRAGIRRTPPCLCDVSECRDPDADEGPWLKPTATFERREGEPAAEGRAIDNPATSEPMRPQQR